MDRGLAKFCIATTVSDPTYDSMNGEFGCVVILQLYLETVTRNGEALSA
jgi:hypothetical protein